MFALFGKRGWNWILEWLFPDGWALRRVVIYVLKLDLNLIDAHLPIWRGRPFFVSFFTNLTLARAALVPAAYISTAWTRWSWWAFQFFWRHILWITFIHNLCWRFVKLFGLLGGRRDGVERRVNAVRSELGWLGFFRLVDRAAWFHVSSLCPVPQLMVSAARSSFIWHWWCFRSVWRLVLLRRSLTLPYRDIINARRLVVSAGWVVISGSEASSFEVHRQCQSFDLCRTTIVPARQW